MGVGHARITGAERTREVGVGKLNMTGWALRWGTPPATLGPRGASETCGFLPAGRK
jgi:hypothetical protein